MWVPLSIKKRKTNKTKKKKKEMIISFGRGSEDGERKFKFFLFSNFSLRFTEFRPLDFVGSNTESALRYEGYAWEPKTRDFIENSGKNLKKS